MARIVKITKTDKFADEPHLPIVYVRKGQTRDDLSDKVADAVIRTGCGEEVKNQNKNAELEAELTKIAAEAKDDSEAKLALEKWGKENLGIDVNRSKSVKNIIKELMKGGS